MAHGVWNSNQGTSPAAGINSTSAANGFLISDPDSANNTAYSQPLAQLISILIHNLLLLQLAH